MADITIFEENSSIVPSFMQQGAVNDDLTAHASGDFRILSIKGKVFTRVFGEERHIIMNPKDPRSTANWIPIVLVKVNNHCSKSFYKTQFTEGSEDNKPTCFSNDGQYPDPSSEEKQCQSCAACQWNRFGTARGANGTVGKGKACSDYIRAAVTIGEDIETPYFLRIPPASMKNIGNYGKLLAKHKAPYQGVVTEMSFDPVQATPLLQFKAIGFVTEPQYRQIMELSNSDDVKRMLSGSSSDHAEAPLPATPAYMQQSTPRTAVSEAESTATIAGIKSKTADDIINSVMGKPAPQVVDPQPAKVVEKPADLSDALAGLSFD